MCVKKVAVVVRERIDDRSFHSRARGTIGIIWKVDWHLERSAYYAMRLALRRRMIGFLLALSLAPRAGRRINLLETPLRNAIRLLPQGEEGRVKTHRLCDTRTKR